MEDQRVQSDARPLAPGHLARPRSGLGPQPKGCRSVHFFESRKKREPVAARPPSSARRTWPSGVSAGHIMPHSVLCSWRGFASLPSRPIGELMRRRCDSVEAYVRRFTTWGRERS